MVVSHKLTIFLLALAHLGLWITTIPTKAKTSDSLNPGDQLNSSTLLCSRNGKHCMVFMEMPQDSGQTYLAIFENTDAGPVVWIGNRNKPIVNNDGVLILDDSGELKIVHQGGEAIINLYTPAHAITNTKAILLDSGNFVLQQLYPNNNSVKSVLWQSFDYPTGTLLPGMKLGINYKTSQNWSLVSYLTDTSPASGSFTLEWEPRSGQLIIQRRGQTYWASGMLKNSKFEHIPEEAQGMYEYTNVSNGDEESFTYTAINEDYAKWTLYGSGQLVDSRGNHIARADGCYGYNTDGGCQKWDLPSCRHEGEIFEVRSGNIKILDLPNLRLNGSTSLTVSDCKAICWSNCRCLAFTNYYSNGTGCVFYNADSLGNIRDAGGDSYYILVSTFPDQHGQSTLRKGAYIWIWIGAVVVIALFICCVGILCLVRKRRKLKLKDINELENNQKKEHDLRVFSYASVMAATDGFSSANKLGEGGFGPVYKGTLKKGKEIAVKRLSRTSRQGPNEFKNELKLISELQHMNLVQLLGCCIDGDERILIYEYMPNKSLDFFLFDSTRRRLLDWRKRFNIIDGIAQGLLYLHKYSRLRVVHRDLKASNILLDENMNPKISDFGMAKIFTQESEGNTSRIAGTRGYMPPEYAREGVFSIKSDVYSFGLLMLEIISGRRNNSFNNDDQPSNLVGHAWELWNEGVGLNLMDPVINDSFVEVQVLRCIHIGLLCVEENAADRPTMSEILSMLTNESAVLPLPKRPAFYFGSMVNASNESLAEPQIYSANGLSISSIDAR